MKETTQNFDFSIDLPQMHKCIERLWEENKDKSFIKKIEISGGVWHEIMKISVAHIEDKYPIVYGTDICKDDKLQNDEFKITEVKFYFGKRKYSN